MKKIIRITTVSSTFRLLSGQMKFLNNHFEIICISSNGKQLNDLTINEGVRIIPVDIYRGISLLKDIVSLFKLIKIFRNEKPWLVHSITPKAGLLSMIAAYISGVENRVHTFTGLLFPTAKGIKRKIYLFADKLICYCATNIIPEGFGVKNDLVFNKVTHKEMNVLGFGNINGINLDYFKRSNQLNLESLQLKKELGLCAENFIFIYVGRICGDKGINELVQAFDLLSSNYNSSKLLLVGPFEDHQDPILLGTRIILKSNKSILHVGYQSDIRPFLMMSNVFVLPSYREGVPNSLIQACSMEMPVIVTNINGCNEIVINEINGLIVEKENVSALHDAMKRFLVEVHLDSKLSLHSREIVSIRYDQKYVWNELLTFYRGLDK